MLKIKHWKRWLVAGLAVATLTAGGLALTAGVVSAHGGGGWFGRGGKGNDGTLLAEELGITVDELKAAREAARDKALEQALEDGTITQEQYDQLQVRKALQPYLDQKTMLAEALGVTVEELEETPLPDLMEELDIDRETLRENTQAAREAAIQQAIADGVITQEQADALEDRTFPGQRDKLPDMRENAGPGMRGPRGRTNEDGERLENNAFRSRTAPSNSF